MKCHLVLLCLGAAFAAANGFITPKYDDEKSKTVFIDRESKSFELKCNVSEASSQGVEWLKNNKSLSEMSDYHKRNHTSILGTMYTLRISEAEERDSGNYSCVIGTERADFQVTPEIMLRIKDDSINVVEGEVLKVKCETKGDPVVRWEFKNATFFRRFDQNDSRVSLYTEGVNWILQVEDIQKDDRGTYTCIGKPRTAPTDDKKSEVTSSCMVRVKDKYAALWPFLGICAEVFILCLIIFIYEKKRNKTELEESDTDQSPDQKNTPDHGKESNLRHRQ